MAHAHVSSRKVGGTDQDEDDTVAQHTSTAAMPDAPEQDGLNRRVKAIRKALLGAGPADVVRLVNETVPERARRAADRFSTKVA